jgi:hypothetical protein
MPTLKFFNDDREAFNAWYREYREKNRDKIRTIGREYMRRKRAALKVTKKKK